MIDIAVRTRLEVEFCGKLDYIIDLLIREDFPEEEVKTFTETVKFFLTYQDIREFVVSALHDKATELAKVFVVIDKGMVASFKKFVSILIALDDSEVLEMLETNFAKDKNLNNFFLLVEEERLQGKSTANCEKLFLSLLTLHGMSLQQIDSFLTALAQDRVYLATRLIENKSFVALRKYTEEVATNDVAGLKQLIPVFIERYDDKINSNYMEMIRITVVHDPSFTDAMLAMSKWDLRFLFEKYILSSSTGNMSLMKNYCQYLADKDSQWFFQFEKQYIETARGTDLVRFATTVPFSSKRAILRKLVEAKEEESLVEFIKNFSEYRNLLPML